MIDIALVVESSRVHHCLPVRNAPPFLSRNILPKLDRILLHFFDVSLLGCAISVANALVVTCVKRITLLKWSKQWLLLYLLLLFWKGDLSAKGRKASLKTTSLAHGIRPGLIAMEDQGVAFSILSPVLILLPLIRVFYVTNRFEVGEGFRFDAGGEPGRCLYARSLRWTLRDVFKLSFLHLLITAGEERSLWRSGSP